MTDIVVLAGPNGAGKTTAARALLPNALALREFANADEIARGLSPFNESSVAVAAGRLMIERMRQLVRSSQSFAFETTCSGVAHIEFLRRCREQGWRVTLLYLWLSSPEAAIDRVARRVRQGGHDIPPEVVARRYEKWIANMRRLLPPLADIASIYDNRDGARILVAQREFGSPLRICDQGRWDLIRRQS